MNGHGQSDDVEEKKDSVFFAQSLPPSPKASRKALDPLSFIGRERLTRSLSAVRETIQRTTSPTVSRTPSARTLTQEHAEAEEANGDMHEMTDEELKAMVEKSNALANALIEEHLAEYLQQRRHGTYESWVAELCPENVKLDERFYLPDAAYLHLWNERATGRKPVTPRVPEPAPVPKKLRGPLGSPIVAAFMAVQVGDAATFAVSRGIVAGAACSVEKAGNAAAGRVANGQTWRSPTGAIVGTVAGVAAGTAWVVAGGLWTADAGLFLAEACTKRGIATTGALTTGLFRLSPRAGAKAYRALAGIHDSTAEVFPDLPAHPVARWRRKTSGSDASNGQASQGRDRRKTINI